MISINFVALDSIEMYPPQLHCFSNPNRQSALLARQRLHFTPEWNMSSPKDRDAEKIPGACAIVTAIT